MKALRDMSKKEIDQAFFDEVLSILFADRVLDDDERKVLQALYRLYRPELEYDASEIETLAKGSSGAPSRHVERGASRLLERLVEAAEHFGRPWLQPDEAQAFWRLIVARYLQPIPRAGSQPLDPALRQPDQRLAVFFSRMETEIRRADLMDDENESPQSGLPESSAAPTASAEPAVRTAESEAGRLPDAVYLDADWQVVRAQVESGLARVQDTDALLKHLTKCVTVRYGGSPRLRKQMSAHFTFGDEVSQRNEPVWVIPELPDGTELWFIGDIHGDLLGMEAALDVIQRHGRASARTVFLGDFIDRGFDDEAVIARLFELVFADKQRACCVLAGNHDVALARSREAGAMQFTTRVSPAGFADCLNAGMTDARLLQDERAGRVGANLRTLGVSFIEFIKACPRALFLPDGLFAAHGGFPHSDLWSDLETGIRLMEDPACQNDFLWNRIADAPLRQPNRMTSGTEFGAKDFLSFCKLATTALEQEVRCMVRGHCHVMNRKERWQRLEGVPSGSQRPRASYAGRVLTINNMSYAMRGEYMGEFGHSRDIALARWRIGEDVLPQPVVIRIPEELALWYAPRCPARDCGQPNRCGATTCEAVKDQRNGERCGAILGGST